MKKRLIVVDPSFTSHDSDRWHYAVDCAKSARELGYDFVLLTNIVAPSIAAHLDFPIKEAAIFPHTFYAHDEIYSRHRKVALPDADRLHNMRLRERLDTIERSIDSSRHRGDDLNAEILSRRKNRLSRLAVLTARLRQLRPRTKRARPFNRDDFAVALARELRKLKPRRGDRIFFHTMTYGMMESLSETTAALNFAEPLDVDAYFLFHFGADSPDARTFLDRYYSYSAYGSIVDRMRVGSPFARIHYLATSESLREEAQKILGSPVGIWHGLVDMRRMATVLGGSEAIATRRTRTEAAIGSREIKVLVRAADLDAQKAHGVSRACHLVQHRGYVVRLRVVYHRGTLSKLRDLIQRIDFPNLELVNTDSNDDYMRELTDASIAVLAYDRDKYDKRVSAVLHDCAVLGVPALVPTGTTLADCDFATKFCYSDTEDMLGALLNAIRFLARNPQAPRRTINRARELLGANALQRLIDCSPEPSLVVTKRAPIANVVMPLWGRVGSSFGIEGQIRHLLERGYFVNQVFLLDKPVNRLDSIEYFWRMLRENSRYTRGSLQRIAFVDESESDKERSKSDYLAAGAFNQFMRRIARNQTEDPHFDAKLKRAEVTIVNHVFNTDWAMNRTGGRRILETHDIQSYQMVTWPLRNDATQEPDDIQALLASEMAAVRRYDHIVNLAPEEHMILSIANPSSSLVTHYLPEIKQTGQYATVDAMARALRWDESYYGMQRFDLLLAADSHLANRESGAWFINEVFKNRLAPHGVSLAIVGRLSQALHAELGTLPYVYYVGFVDDLDSVKALSNIIVLPDRRGTGMSIKTLEAFASGKPFVGTSVAYRGLRGRIPVECQAYDEPEEMAHEIMRILSDKTHYAARERLAHECYRAVASKERFAATWDAAIDPLTSHRLRTPASENDSKLPKDETGFPPVRSVGT